MDRFIDIDTLKTTIAYHPDSGLFSWVQSGRGRALGLFTGTPVIKTGPRTVIYSRDPATGEILIDPATGQRQMENAPARYEHRGFIIRIAGRTYPAHTLAYALQTGVWSRVSHLNGDKRDNRWDNLTTDREGSRAYQAQNASILDKKVNEILAAQRVEKEELEGKTKKTVADIKERYAYDPDKGLFMRLNTEYVNWDRGTPVKSNNSRALYYRDKGEGSKSCPCHIAAWILQTGTYPTGKVYHHNHDKNDNRWSNLSVK